MTRQSRDNFVAQLVGSALVGLGLGSAGAPLWGVFCGCIGANLIAGSYTSHLRERLGR